MRHDSNLCLWRFPYVITMESIAETFSVGLCLQLKRGIGWQEKSNDPFSPHLFDRSIDALTNYPQPSILLPNDKAHLI